MEQDVDELIKEYAAVEAVAEDILSDKQQVKEVFFKGYCTFLQITFVYLLADSWFGQQMEQRKGSTTTAEKSLPKCEEWW